MSRALAAGGTAERCRTTKLSHISLRFLPAGSYRPAARRAARRQMARCTGSPATATAVRTVTLSRRWRTEPQASLSLPEASDTPISDIGRPKCV